MIPDFRYFIDRVKELQPPRHIIDRCNLTILLEAGYEDLGEFLAMNKVEIIASMPCYSAENVNAQRGEGVFEASIAALQLLNSLGYGIDPELPLHLVYNPVGAFLPPSQDDLEVDYKRELKKHFGIIFNKLYALSNLPIGRFRATCAITVNSRNTCNSLLTRLIQQRLADSCVATQSASAGAAMFMIATLISSSDCNGPAMAGASGFFFGISIRNVEGRDIMTGDHCFGCTAGAGSSCGGAISSVS